MKKPRSTRVDVDLYVDLICDGITRRCCARNIGLGGIFVNPEIYWVPAPGTAVELCFLGLHTMSATVLRSDNTGMALLFSEVDKRDFAFLSALLHSRAA